MAQEFNEKKMRKDLIKLYREFIEQPESENVKSNLIKFDRDFGGLVSYNDYLKSQPVPKYIQDALGAVADLGLYGEGFRSKEECLSFAKETLSKLKEIEESNSK